MPNPLNIKMFVDPDTGENVQHDPRDRVDYLMTLDGTDGMLEAGENVSTYTLTVTAEGAALGLTIGTAAYAPTQPTTNQIKMWLEIGTGFQANAAYDGEGQIFGIEVEISTTNTPARRRQRTVGIQVAQQ